MWPMACNCAERLDQKRSRPPANLEIIESIGVIAHPGPVEVLIVETAVGADLGPGAEHQIGAVAGVLARVAVHIEQHPAVVR